MRALIINTGKSKKTYFIHNNEYIFECNKKVNGKHYLRCCKWEICNATSKITMHNDSIVNVIHVDELHLHAPDYEAVDNIQLKKYVRDRAQTEVGPLLEIYTSERARFLKSTVTYDQIKNQVKNDRRMRPDRSRDHGNLDTPNQPKPAEQNLNPEILNPNDKNPVPANQSTLAEENWNPEILHPNDKNPAAANQPELAEENLNPEILHANDKNPVAADQLELAEENFNPENGLSENAATVSSVSTNNQTRKRKKEIRKKARRKKIRTMSCPSCMIRLYELNEQQKWYPGETRCSHRFHKRCIQSLRETYKVSECPACDINDDKVL